MASVQGLQARGLVEGSGGRHRECCASRLPAASPKAARATWFRPLFLAWYSAWSTREDQGRLLFSTPCRSVATPKLAVTGYNGHGAVSMEARIRSATPNAAPLSVWGRMITNSSPP